VYFVQFSLGGYNLDHAPYRDKESCECLLCVFRAPLNYVKLIIANEALEKRDLAKAQLQEAQSEQRN
jgi:hypothetical protein